MQNLHILIVTVQSCVKENKRMAGSGEVSEGSPSDYNPLQRHVTADRVHGPDAAPARGEAERHPEPFPQDRFGVRTRPAVPLGRRKPAPPARLRTRGRGFPSPDSVLRPGGSRGVRVPPAVSVLSVGLNRYTITDKNAFSAGIPPTGRGNPHPQDSTGP